MLDDLGRDPLFLAMLGGIFGLLVIGVALIGAAVRFRVRNNRTAREWARREAMWDPIILAALAGIEPDEAVHRLVTPSDRFFFVDYLMRYARRLAGAERATIERLAAPYLAQLVALYRARDESFRARAVRTIGTLGGQQYRDLFVEALDDPSDLVAMAAARSLTLSGSAEHAAAVVDKLSRFAQWRPSLVASMLAQVGPAIAASLRALVADLNADPAIRVIGVAALTELSDPLAADIGAQLLAETTDRNLIVAILGLIFVAGREEHLAVVSSLVDSPEPAIRAQAFAVVARFGPALSADQIARVLQDESPWVPIRVVEALASVGAAGLVAELNAANLRS